MGRHCLCLCVCVFPPRATEALEPANRHSETLRTRVARQDEHVARVRVALELP